MPRFYSGPAGLTSKAEKNPKAFRELHIFQDSREADVVNYWDVIGKVCVPILKNIFPSVPHIKNIPENIDPVLFQLSRWYRYYLKGLWSDSEEFWPVCSDTLLRILGIFLRILTQSSFNYPNFDPVCSDILLRILRIFLRILTQSSPLANSFLPRDLESDEVGKFRNN